MIELFGMVLGKCLERFKGELSAGAAVLLLLVGWLCWHIHDRDQLHDADHAAVMASLQSVNTNLLTIGLALPLQRSEIMREAEGKFVGKDWFVKRTDAIAANVDRNASEISDLKTDVRVIKSKLHENN